ncbi:DDE 3 domain containing protein, partial [Asbolus verrucosus]
RDGATTHTTAGVLAHLREFYDDRLISLRSVPEYPSRYPDLTPLEYVMIPHLKNTIFKTSFETIQELRRSIAEECTSITPESKRHVFNNMKKRDNSYLAVEGQHLEHLL